MGEALKVQSLWLEKFSVGLLQITEQKRTGYDFYKGSERFDASNEITLFSDNVPDFAGKTLYVRGRNKKYDRKVIIIKDKEMFLKAIEAVRQYNEATKNADINYLTLHYRLWMKLADTGEQCKTFYADEIAAEVGIAPPRSGCFLCEDVASTTAKGSSFDCSRCKGYWGFGRKRCTDHGAYFRMWESEGNVELRIALARRIANNVSIDAPGNPKVLPGELNVALQTGKFQQSSCTKNAQITDWGSQKEAIEEAMDNYLYGKESKGGEKD